MNRSQRLVLGTLCAVLAVAGRAPEASAAAEVHKLNLLLSSNPTGIQGEDYKRFLDDYNRRVLEPGDREGIEKIQSGWFHQAELRYFVRPNIAIGAGLGQIRIESAQEYLPRVGQRLYVRTNVVSVPVHVGGSYYFAPYNQGDFQARWYVGGGLMSNTNNKVFFEQLEGGADTTTTLGGTFRLRGRRDSPGFYVETGAHLFFASRWSVMLGLMYRSAMIREPVFVRESFDRSGRMVQTQLLDSPFDLDLGGVGARMGVLWGF